MPIWVTFIEDTPVGFFTTEIEAARLADALRSSEPRQHVWIDDRQLDELADEMIDRFRRLDRIRKELEPVWADAFGM